MADIYDQETERQRRRDLKAARDERKRAELLAMVCNLCGQGSWSGGVSETGGLLPHKCPVFEEARRTRGEK